MRRKHAGRIALPCGGGGKKCVWNSYTRNAPLSSRLPLFVWLSGVRWAVEQCFEEVKTELGMDHYEIRKYSDWHHHMLTCMLAHFFLWHLKIRLAPIFAD
jgi:SRSO17 transposase